jgi:hypothetical protein
VKRRRTAFDPRLNLRVTVRRRTSKSSVPRLRFAAEERVPDWRVLHRTGGALKRYAGVRSWERVGRWQSATGSITSRRVHFFRRLRLNRDVLATRIARCARASPSSSRLDVRRRRSAGARRSFGAPGRQRRKSSCRPRVLERCPGASGGTVISIRGAPPCRRRGTCAATLGATDGFARGGHREFCRACLPRGGHACIGHCRTAREWRVVRLVRCDGPAFFLCLIARTDPSGPPEN